MAKNNPSLADLSRMRREARRAVAEDTSVEATEQEARQSNKAETSQKPNVQEVTTVELEEHASSDRSDRQSKISNDSKLKIVPESKPVEIEEQKKVGRPKGIRSNPDYESTTIRLHKQIKAKARYILSTQPEKMDLQTLLNNLLEDFVREQET